MAQINDTQPLRRSRELKSATAPRPHLFLVLECDRPLAGGARHNLHGLASASVGRGESRSVQRGESTLALTVPDGRISRAHARLESVLGGWVLTDSGSRNGTFVNGAKIERAVLADGDVIEIGHTLLLFRAAVPVSSKDPPDQDAASARPLAPGMATLLPSLARELAMLEQIARSTVPVLIRGESGTGKELVARAVHALSARSGPFVAANCGAIAPNLVESELFGHRRGAFTGAAEDRPGLLRAADGGTLLLDEIGDLPLLAQAALLRVLQEGEVLSVGATKPERVNVRAVSATHRDLDALVAEERFRGDLMARINGFSVTLPPLRERREDLGTITAALLARAGREASFASDAARALLQYDWPGNIRELEQALGAALVLAGSGLVELAHLPPALCGERPPSAKPEESDDAQRAALIAMLEKHQGNISAVAREMGKARMQIQRRLKRYGLVPESFKR